MQPKRGTLYTIGFAAAVCLVCSVLVSVSAVVLAPRQQQNKKLDEKRNVLVAAGLIGIDDPSEAPQVEELYAKFIKPVVIDLRTGTILDDDPASFDQRLAESDPDESILAPDNKAKIIRLPKKAMVYQVRDGDQIQKIILPVSGKGLWSTIRGFIALSSDISIITGIAFHEHGETPGLGGEIENPKWRALWNGRKAFDEKWTPVIAVIKGTAGSVENDPHHVDGLSGATLTANGVTELVRFWLGDNGYGPYLKKLRDKRGNR